MLSYLLRVTQRLHKLFLLKLNYYVMTIAGILNSGVHPWVKVSHTLFLNVFGHFM